MKYKIITILIALLGLVVFIAHNKTVEGAAPTNGLVGYWNFDEGSGAVANDNNLSLNT